MEVIRKPYLGVWNIIRFNRRFFILAITLLAILYSLAYSFAYLNKYLLAITIILSLLVITPLLVSWYVYDLSPLYHLNWIGANAKHNNTILNINAGFDEITPVLKQKYKEPIIYILDFYNPDKHTEPSIERARKIFPPAKTTIKVSTSFLPFEDCKADYIYLFLAAHEIRDEQERIAFFKELSRVLKPSGCIYVTEHLRNIPNFAAYTIGFFHFYSEHAWLKTFKSSGLILKEQIKNNCFISTFILTKNGNTF